MAKRDQPFEPAFGYSILFVFAALVVTLCGLTRLGDGSWAGPVLVASGGAYGLLLVGLVGAMAEPLPRDPGDGKPGPRLAVCWGILGLCPPPGRWTRVALGAALMGLFGLAVGSFDELVLGGAALLLAPAALLGRPQDILNMDVLETWYFGTTTLAGIAALLVGMSEPGADALCAAGALFAVALLHAQRARELTALRWARVLPGVKPPPALDLSRYELKVERRAPAEPAALPAGVEERLVDTGSFRVDAAKMLDKLRKYQLSDPRDFLSAWLRCAAASGASSIELTTGWTSLTLRFDGRAFTPAELSQPYQALVDSEGEDAERGRHFAYGLLALYRLDPRGFSVVSRGPRGVAVMNAGAAAAPDADAAREGTLVTVTWPAWAVLWRVRTLASRARAQYGLGPAAFSIDGRLLPRRPTGSEWSHGEKAGWRASSRSSTLQRRVRLYVLGTFIEELRPDGNTLDAWLACDGLRLDISQSSVVRGKELDEGLGLLSRRAI
ncbi:hypothetical protein EPO15_08915 [bacterium]|nr:MAG: hypothetical protein EPO15_08915 [bacterium]